MYRLKGGGWHNRADPIGPCAYAGVGPFRAGRVVVGGGGVLWAVCVQGREPDARVSRLPMIILLGGYSDTLLVVSILDIVYDCHLRPLLQS